MVHDAERCQLTVRITVRLNIFVLRRSPGPSGVGMPDFASCALLWPVSASVDISLLRLAIGISNTGLLTWLYIAETSGKARSGANGGGGKILQIELQA